jgi:hypothetical protein
MDEKPKIAVPSTGTRRRPFAWSSGPEQVKARRHWYQFRLITALVAMMLLGVPLAYVGSQIRVIRHRKAVLDLVSSCGGSYSFERGDKGGGTVGVIGPFSEQTRALVPAIDIRQGDRKEIPSEFRRWLGDKSVGFIMLPRTAPCSVIDQTADIPEAHVCQLQ